MKKTKNKYIIANLHLLNSKVDSGFSQNIQDGFSSRNKQQLKAAIYFCKKSQPRYPGAPERHVMILCPWEEEMIVE